MDRAKDLGCVGAFQIFTSSPRRWAARPLEEMEVDLFRGKIAKFDFIPFAHMPYMPNLASPDSDFYSQSVDVLIREIERCEKLGVPFIVAHFGSFMNSSPENGQSKIVKGCRKALQTTKLTSVRVLLENSAGSRGSIGMRFEKIGEVMKEIGEPDRLGVCLDTCHALAAGYDFRSRAGIEQVLENFDRSIGLEKLHLIHANDSVADLGEAKDRHEHIGLGKIGVKGFKSLFEAEKIHSIPVVLETPIDDRRNDFENVAFAKKLAGL